MSNNDLRCLKCGGQHHPVEECPTPERKGRMGKICKNCGGDTAIRNPTGKCDHLHYPDNLQPLVEVYDKWNTYLESDDMSHEGDNEMMVDIWNVIKTVVKNHKGER